MGSIALWIKLCSNNIMDLSFDSPSTLVLFVSQFIGRSNYEEVAAATASHSWS